MSDETDYIIPNKIVFGVEVGVEESIHLKNTDFSNCRLKTQTTEKVRLDLHS
jgi:hypothetical protein